MYLKFKYIEYIDGTVNKIATTLKYLNCQKSSFRSDAKNTAIIM